MVEYSRKMDWQINNNVKIELVKRWVDVQKLRICTTKGNVEIKGSLEFTGRAAQDLEAVAVMNLLKNLDLALKGISNLRDVKWDLDCWKKVGSRWQPAKVSKEKEKEEELKQQAGGQ
ncbi:MAG: hypothetical protein PHE88_08315 [Elusimicrobia bacterium]|nr:hypothetical protein [Elusimicrobiota bacterium]